MKKLVEASPVIAAFLIFMGFLKLYIFYGHWGINIIEYLDFTEILLSFLGDLSILVFFIALYIIHVIIGFRITAIVEQHTGKVESKEQEQASEKQEISGNGVNSKNNIVSEIIEEIFITKKWIGILCVFGITILFLVLFYFFHSLVWLYFSIFILLQGFYFVFALFLNENSSFQVSLIVSFFCFTILIAQYDIKEVERKSVIDLYTITYNDQTIETNRDNNYLGRTSKYIFLFNKIQKKTEILKIENVKNIEIVRNQ